MAEIVGGGTPSTKKSEYWNGNINWFSPAEIGNQIFVSHSQKQITELGLLKSSAKMLPAGTILFTSRAGIGNTAILTRNACTNQGFQSIVPNSHKLDSYFIYSESAKLKRYGETMGSGSTFTEVSGKQMRKMLLHIPNITEQAKIGNMIKILDQTITLHEEKKRQLEHLKSALLQMMFADKSRYPAVRFEGFSDEWEQCKLGDVCEPITDSIDTQKYPNEVFAEYSMPAFDASMKPDIVLGSSMNSVRKIITRPCLLVNKLNVRKKRIWYVKKPNKNAVCSAEFIPLYSDTVDLTFLNQVAKSETFTRYLENHSSGSSNSQKRITPRSLMLSKLYIPTIEEQKLIGKIFESLDHTITLHDQKLSLLKRVKQTLLQKMFI